MTRAPATLAAVAAMTLAACSSRTTEATKAKPEAGAQPSPHPSPSPTLPPAEGGKGGGAQAAASAAGAAAPASPKLCQHGVPADQCTKCNPDLVAVFKEMGDWCEEHGLPKSHCRQCNPGLRFDGEQPAAAAAEPWCKEHAVPEAMCTKCRPQLIAKFIAAGDYCREHGYPESVCPYCHPEKVKAAGHALPVFPEPGTKIRLANAGDTERKAGITTVRADERELAGTIEVVGQLELDQDRLARLSARGDSLVLEAKVDAGEDVRRGQALVVLASGSVGGARSRRLAAEARVEAARKALEREDTLAKSGISSRREVEQARSELAAAEAERDSARAELRASGAAEAGAGGRYALAAPFDGTVVSREAVAGRTASAGDVLVEVADVRKLWAVLDVPEEQAAAVRPGQRVTLRLEGTDGARDARVTRVGAAVDPRTRTVRVRVDVPNEDRSLRAGSFILATIEVSPPRKALLVPRGAVQRAQEHDLVFVRTAPGQYDPVEVKVGARTRDEVEIAGGLRPGVDVVTVGAFTLKTEILKDSIGAGCADGD